MVPRYGSLVITEVILMSILTTIMYIWLFVACIAVLVTAGILSVGAIFALIDLIFPENPVNE